MLGRLLLPLEVFLRWYKRVGQPVDFTTRLSPGECQHLLKTEAVPWNTPQPLSLKRYRAQVMNNGAFRLRHRRRLTRPFVGQLEPLPGGGTRVYGYVENETSFLGFLAFMTLASPIAGGLTYGPSGLIGGLVVAVVLIIAGLGARLAEEKSHAAQAFQEWLYETLRGDSLIIDGASEAPKPRLPRPQ